MIKKLLCIWTFVFCFFALYAEENLSLPSLALPKAEVDAKLQKYIKYNPEGPNLIGHIGIDDKSTAISESTWLYVKKAIEFFKEKKVIFVIVELNTPGGEVFAAEKISDALKQLDIQDGIPCVAFIDNWAISAGAMIALSCRFIAVTKDGAMGAAEPVLASETGEMKSASEKVNSAIRADFANRASFFDRNPNIAEAMVDKDILLVYRDGKIIKLDNDSQIKPTDILIKPKGKLLTLNAEQLIQYGIADFLVLPAKLEPITVEEKEKGTWPANNSLLFQNEYLSRIPEATIVSYRMDWKTHFFVILATPMVASLLVLGLMLGAYMEFMAPGHGVAGTIALICLFLIILSSLSLEIANWLEVILFLTGLAVILVELFVLPTFGLLGFFGIIIAVAGLLGMLIPGLGSASFDFDTQSFNAAGYALIDRLAWFSLTIIIGILLIILLSRYFAPSFRLWNKFVLTGSEQDASQGYVAGDIRDLPKVGDKGEVISTLRPAGKVVINDKVYDAITDGTFIEQGTTISVSRLEGSVIYVDNVMD